MYSHVITYKTLNEAIKVAFTGDEKIIPLYDPTKEVHSVEEIIEDVYRKIKEYEDGSLVMNGVYEKNELIGYFVYRKGMLISFSINVKYRTRQFLRQFFSMIRKEIGRYFIAHLWTKNARAIKWLCKNGMQIINSNNLITQLICP